MMDKSTTGSLLKGNFFNLRTSTIKYSYIKTIYALQRSCMSNFFLLMIHEIKYYIWFFVLVILN